MQVKIQFSRPAQDLLSEEYGPFDYVEMTYDDLWEPDRTKIIASRTTDGL